MTIQDCSEVRNSSAVPTVGNGGQIMVEEGHVPKIRKPYTITRQRERWTEEEHKRFLEALKLYGRAWRKIEEHVGTKTAVQIRSHAQKFFSKVVHEPNSIEPVEIPPPRPKRKPTHPYPQKLVLPAKKGAPVQEQSAKSASLNSSLDQKNQSPTSVLHVPDGSSSPVSTCEDVNPAANMTYEDGPSEEENVSGLDEPVSMKLELLPKHEVFDKEGSVEASSSSKSLRLFGKILSVAKVENPSTLASECTENVAIPAVCSHSPSAPLPPWAFYGGMPFIPVNIAGVTKAESQSAPTEVQKEPDRVSELNPSANPGGSSSSSSGECKQGFLPYQRGTSDIDEVRRFHLCL